MQLTCRQSPLSASHSLHVWSLPAVSTRVACRFTSHSPSLCQAALHLSLPLQDIAITSPCLSCATSDKVYQGQGVSSNRYNYQQSETEAGPVSCRPCQLIRLHRFAFYPTCGLKVTLLISPECPARVATQLPLIVLYNLRQKAMSTRH
jgi:hypothetical protein